MPFTLRRTISTSHPKQPSAQVTLSSNGIGGEGRGEEALSKIDVVPGQAQITFHLLLSFRSCPKKIPPVPYLAQLKLSSPQ
jgi:hypothetical protein